MLWWLLCAGAVLLNGYSSMAAGEKPNIVYILADDLGYGDVRAFNPDSKIATPNLDRLASQGMIFTDAHSGSAVCTPTRYGILTGRYAWRSRLKKGVQGGMSPRLIEPGRLTVPTFLKEHGYRTACIGKWHLGMDWQLKTNGAPFNDNVEKGQDAWRVDFSKPIFNGPNSVGFDYFFGIAASLDMVPYTFIENDRVVALPTVDKAFPMVLGRTNAMTRRGPGADTFEAADVLPTLTAKAIEQIERAAGPAKAGTPFFLYFPLTAPHTPVVPTEPMQRKSGVNYYADFVMQMDDTVGAVLQALEQHGLASSTLVIFTSDNGCSPQANFAELRAQGHNPNYRFRGAKADAFEGGHRIPFILRWPGHVKPGSKSDRVILLNDLLATCADFLETPLPADAGEDSASLLYALGMRGDRPRRKAIVHHSAQGTFAIRRGPWKLILSPDSGGWSDPQPGSAAAKALPAVQLYDLSNDLGETNNLQASQPAVVRRLSELMDLYLAEGRSIPAER